MRRDTDGNHFAQIGRYLDTVRMRLVGAVVPFLRSAECHNFELRRIMCRKASAAHKAFLIKSISDIGIAR